MLARIFFRPNDGSCNAFKLDLSTDQSLRSLRLERYTSARRGAYKFIDSTLVFYRFLFYKWILQLK